MLVFEALAQWPLSVIFREILLQRKVDRGFEN